MKPNLKTLFQNLKSSFPSLRAWQEKFSDYWEKYSNMDLIGIRTCTGSGKTLITLLILEQGRRNDKLCVYLTHTNQLMNRIAKEAKQLNIPYIILSGAKGITGAAYRKRQQQIFDYNQFKHIIISNYAVFLRTADFPKNIDILVIDDVDLFYENLRDYFSIRIKSSGSTQEIYIQIIESLAVEYSGPEKKELAIKLISKFYDDVFNSIDIPAIPNILEPVIHRYVKSFLLVLVGATIDAMVATFRKTLWPLQAIANTKQR
jgi:Rad3-related DNA helicase